LESCELQPTDENVLGSFLDDRMERNIDILYFISFLNSITGKFSIALDGKWGSGKTFFVKQVMMVLDTFNDSVEQKNKDTEKVKALVQSIPEAKNAKLTGQPQVCVYYDAWENDNDNDPILSLVYAILQSNENYEFKSDCGNREKAREIVVNIAKHLLGRISGINVSELSETVHNTINGTDPLVHLKAEKDVKNSVNEFLKTLTVADNRLVIFIDELDRCKPTYAIRLLERIKHYFFHDKITFVFSTNLEELQHTIKCYYGDKFNATQYLEKFFDIHMVLPPINKHTFYRQLELADTTLVNTQICRAVIEANNFEFREAKKFVFFTKAILKETCNALRINSSDTFECCLFFVAPVLIGLIMKDQTLYAEFIKGNNSKPLHDVLKIYDRHFGRDTRFGQDSIIDSLESCERSHNAEYVHYADTYVETIAELMYSAIFKKEGTAFGGILFDDKARDRIMRSVSPISKFAYFNKK